MKIQPLRPLLLPLLIIIAITLLAFLLPSLSVVDNTIIRLVQLTPDNWESAMLFIAKLGDPTPLVIVALLVAIWELVHHRFIRALVMAGSLIAMPAFYLVKETVHRARPLTEYVAQQGLHDFSFPSGHATGIMAVYGMIAYLIYSRAQGRLRWAGVSISVAIIIFVSFTRIYLGAHFPTDVFAGWLLAFVIINLLRSLSLYLAKRSSVPNRKAIEDTPVAPEEIEK